MCFSSGSNSLQQQQLDQQQAEEAQRQANLTTGMNNIDSTFDQFNNSGIYDNIRQSYLNYAEPALQQQYTQASNDLQYALARQGITNSSAAADLQGKLEQQEGQAAQQVSSAADDAVNSAEQNAVTAKNNAVSTLTAANDPNAAQSVLSSNLKAISGTPTYGSLGTLIGGVTSGLASGVNGATNSTGLLGTSTGGTALYNNGSASSAKTVNG